MKNETQNIRSKEELIDENIKFLAKLRSEDVEYTPLSLECIANDSKNAACHILDHLRKVDVNSMYYKAYPRDGDVVRYDNTLFKWQIEYFDQFGDRIKTYEQVQREPIVDRIVTIISPEDEKRITSKPLKF